MFFTNKKGDVQVDWVLSAGIFLIAIFLLFAFLKPGIVPITEKKVTLEALEEGFNNNFTWQVKTVPLFVEFCESSDDPAGGFQDTNVDIDLLNNWGFSNLDFKDDTNEWVRGVSGVSYTMTCQNGASNDETDDLYHITNPAKFVFTYFNDGFEPLASDISVGCRPSNCKYNGKLGSEEEIAGLNENWLSGIGGYSSEELKSLWKVPTTNEFWVQGWRESDPNCGAIDSASCTYFVDYKTANITDDDNVNVKESRTFLLDQNGYKEEVRILFRVW